MTQAHLEQRLQDLRGNLKLMQELYIDSETPYALLAELFGHMINRVNEIGEVKKQLAQGLKLERIDNIFHEPIQFDIKEIEGTYPNTTNAWHKKLNPTYKT